MAGFKQAAAHQRERAERRLVFDMVYNPLETPLLKLAHSRGIPVISGLEMFVQQGARQFEIWTGKPAPEAEMQRVVESGTPPETQTRDRAIRKHPPRSDNRCAEAGCRWGPNDSSYADHRNNRLTAPAEKISSRALHL
jgi:hypothetical protein